MVERDLNSLKQILER